MFASIISFIHKTARCNLVSHVTSFWYSLTLLRANDVERIQEAIDKARKERQGFVGGEFDTSDQPAGQSAADSRLHNRKMSAVSSINYTNTRKLSFSEDELKSKLLIAGFAHDARSEPYRQLRSQILKTMRANNWQSLAITSPTKGNGKTLTAMNLAICLSQEVNQTVLLVDLDLRNPSIANILDLEDIEQGIVDCAFDKTDLEKILINPGYQRLVVAPGTAQGHHTSEILSSPQMLSLQEELKSRYADRIIIYDLPPLLESDDALVFTPKADSVLVVIEDGGCTKAELKRAIRLLEGANILGTVINKMK